MHRALTFAALLTLTAAPMTEAELQLSVDGESDYRIIISYDAFHTVNHPQISSAWEELQHFFRQITGATRPTSA